MRELDGQMWMILARAALLEPDARVPIISGIVTAGT